MHPKWIAICVWHDSIKKQPDDSAACLMSGNCRDHAGDESRHHSGVDVRDGRCGTEAALKKRLICTARRPLPDRVNEQDAILVTRHHFLPSSCTAKTLGAENDLYGWGINGVQKSTCCSDSTWIVALTWRRCRRPKTIPSWGTCLILV